MNYSHLPAWLERSKLFRLFFLIRKLYLIQVRFSHYAQFAEDISIRRLLEKKKTGFFVDVGCFHPKKYNNTWRLYRQGWRGINIDIDPIKITGFNVVRTQDTNLCCAVSDQEGEIEYFSNGFYALTTSLDQTFAETQGLYKKKKTQSKQLTTLIEQTAYKGREIDFLSVDAEGHDLAVLKSLDFDTYRPKLIAVETHLKLFSEVEKSPLYLFLQDRGYSLVGWVGLTLLLAHPDFQQELRES
jgi:FkbM family methyltransferase